MTFKEPMHYDNMTEYKTWLKENCGEQFKDWKFNYWKFDLVYGVTIVDPEVELLFRLRFQL